MGFLLFLNMEQVGMVQGRLFYAVFADDFPGKKSSIEI